MTLGVSITRIAQDGLADRLEVNADLVSATGVKPDEHQTHGAVFEQHPV